MPFLIIVTGIGSKLVLLLLLGLSVWSVSIMIDRFRALKLLGEPKDIAEAQGFIEAKDWKALADWAKGKSSVYAGTIRLLFSVDRSSPELVDRAVKGYLGPQRKQLEKGLSVLATLGSNAPFLGLFGTVLGIIQAFGVLASSPSGSSSVMASLAEALVATAVGLLVAMPALVAFNYFSRRLKNGLSECETARDLLLAHGSKG